MGFESETSASLTKSAVTNAVNRMAEKESTAKREDRLYNLYRDFYAHETGREQADL